MKHYQRKKNNPYLLPHNLYMCILYMIRDYDRLKDERLNILESSPPPADGMPKGSGTSDPTADKAMRLAIIGRHLEAVEQALIQIPHEYRKGVIDSILYRVQYPDDAHERTYKRWRQRFVFFTAKNMGLI